MQRTCPQDVVGLSHTKYAFQHGDKEGMYNHFSGSLNDYIRRIGTGA